MSLTYNRFTIATLVVILSATLALSAMLFMVDVDTAQAETCGAYYLYDFACRYWCRVIPEYCDGVIYWYECDDLKFEQYTNPWTQKWVGSYGRTYHCGYIGNTCPSTSCQ